MGKRRIQICVSEAATQTEQLEDANSEVSKQNTEKADAIDSGQSISSGTEKKDEAVSEEVEKKSQEIVDKNSNDKEAQTTQPQTTEPASQQPVQEALAQETPEQEEPQPPEPPQEVQPVSYSPQRVVELATEQTKAVGKIYLPDDLDRTLAEGSLSKEDYDACYPTDGAGYLEYYVATDLNEARDISGTVKFNSEADIAANIAGMYGALPQQYFYIEYHGTIMYGSCECYVFYCYRA